MKFVDKKKLFAFHLRDSKSINCGSIYTHTQKRACLSFDITRRVQLPRQDIRAVIRISNSLANFHCARNATYVIATLGYLELACCCAVDWVARHARYMKRSLADFNEIPDYFNAGEGGENPTF